jgi:hypothetical protein
MSPRVLTRTARRLRGLVGPALAAVLALVMLVGVMRAGARYFYCPTMHMVIDRPCCAGDGDPRRADEDAFVAEVRSRDCCEEHVLGKLPSAAVSSATPLADVPLLAVVAPLFVPVRALPLAAPSRFEHDTRAGPKALARHRAELMAFLI